MSIQALNITLLIVAAVVLVPTAALALTEAWRRNHGRPRW